MGNSPQKKSGKNFLMGISMRFTILWEIPLSTFSYGKSPPQEKIFPMENSLLFSPTPYGRFPQEKLSPMGNPHYFSPSPPYGKFPKKIWKKIFLRDIWTTVPPKMGVPPEERGHGGDTYPPPIYPIGGGNYLFGYLFGCYLFSVLLILFILAVSDAMLSFIFATFLLWRYLL